MALDITAIIVALIGVAGSIFSYIRSQQKSNDSERNLLMSVAHWAIVSEAKFYVDRGYITTAEFETFHILIKPYLELGGNGLAIKMVEEMNNLPSRMPKE